MSNCSRQVANNRRQRLWKLETAVPRSGQLTTFGLTSTAAAVMSATQGVFLSVLRYRSPGHRRTGKNRGLHFFSFHCRPPAGLHFSSRNKTTERRSTATNSKLTNFQGEVLFFSAANHLCILLLGARNKHRHCHILLKQLKQ